MADTDGLNSPPQPHERFSHIPDLPTHGGELSDFDSEIEVVDGFGQPGTRPNIFHIASPARGPHAGMRGEGMGRAGGWDDDGSTRDI